MQMSSSRHTRLLAVMISIRISFTGRWRRSSERRSRISNRTLPSPLCSVLPEILRAKDSSDSRLQLLRFPSSLRRSEKNSTRTCSRLPEAKMVTLPKSSSTDLTPSRRQKSLRTISQRRRATSSSFLSRSPRPTPTTCSQRRCSTSSQMR